MKKLVVVINGAGSAGIAIGKHLMNLGVRHLLMVDRYGILADAEKDITKEQIDNAIKVITDSYSVNWSVHESSANIVRDSEGDYYVRIGVSRNIDGQVTAMQLYINII